MSDQNRSAESPPPPQEFGDATPARGFGALVLRRFLRNRMAMVSLFLVLSGQVVGTILGSLQGYLGGRFDILSQRAIEVLIAVPFLYVVIVMAALFQPTFWMLLLIMAAFQWIGRSSVGPAKMVQTPRPTTMRPRMTVTRSRAEGEVRGAVMSGLPNPGDRRRSSE